ncbi:MAG: hypothetical protein RL635_744 [Chloroflexota bacterium]|jgi:large subunit ribosomal protein L31|nr:MAG: 50S ribosomal protein L31 [Chloroflexota bacterium]
MRANIHPKYFTAAKVVCSCGNSWTTGATLELVRTDLCYKCHPFYTGEQRLIDTEGQVERFLKKLDVRQKHLALEAERQLEPEIVDVPLVDLKLGARATTALTKEGLLGALAILERLKTSGDAGVLAIQGFGQKGLIDLKKALRLNGFEVPGDAPEPAAEVADS